MGPSFRALAAALISSAFACGGSEANAPPPQEPVPAPPPRAHHGRARVAASIEPNNDEEVIASMRQSFRECYQIGLWNNPHQSGSIRLVLHIDGRGHPASVTPEGGNGLDRMVVDCLVRVARRGSFAPRTSSDGNIVVPMKFGTDREHESASTAEAPSKGN
jgi:hypothetical protein